MSQAELTRHVTVTGRDLSLCYAAGGSPLPGRRGTRCCRNSHYRSRSSSNAMSVATPTILPRSPHFPLLLPKPPQPHPVPLPKHDQRTGRLNSLRDLQREMDDLSDEEEEIVDMREDIRNRGFSFLVPIGRTFTRHEEKNDASADELSDDSDGSEGSEDEDSPSIMEDEENDTAEEDLDADMEDLDEEGLDEEDEEDEEPPSDR
ncbi:uncharacterized protein FIBRA_05773 [Fibroporia radiculosa]|uniref:Uncharacterized protein n=1 Tax=Fibroporia radiculosa TaxID=599839 RepID=J4H3Q0_9APHY|nr:uncharacterized protein FIBRA_05773 [Fibroporia radiculosa]CCM03629.1 predicted protein [Fibroporia radiculosa]